MRRKVSGGSYEYAAVKFVRVPESPEETRTLLDMGYREESIREKYQRDVDAVKKEFDHMDKLKGEPNIVHCDAFSVVPLEGELGYCLVIKMELLTPLEKVVRQPYDEGQAISLGKDIAQALAACGKRGIIHRDIKPANILVSDSGGTYKLGDFGVSKIQAGTASGTKAGTWAFMAPEVYNNRRYNTSVDIYSLGMVLYWLMNRRCEPFLPLPPAIPAASEVQSARMRRFNGELLPMPVDGSAALKNIVLRACDPDPKKRFGSPEEMYNALDAIPDGSYHYSYTSTRGSASGNTGGRTGGSTGGSTGGGGDFWEQKGREPQDGQEGPYVNGDPVYLSPEDDRKGTETFRMYRPSLEPIKVVIPPHTAEKGNPVDAAGYIVNTQGEVVDPSRPAIPLKINTILAEDTKNIRKRPDAELKARMGAYKPKKGFMYYFWCLVLIVLIVEGIYGLCTGIPLLLLIAAAMSAALYGMKIYPYTGSPKKKAAAAKAELERRYGLWIR